MLISKFILMLIATLFSGIGIGLTVAANLGLAPWDVLHRAFSIQFGWSMGTSIIVVSIITLLTWIPLKQKPGIGTIAGMFLVGLSVDATLWLVSSSHYPPLQWIYLSAGLVLFSFGVSAFVHAQLGVGPRDGLMLGLKKLGFASTQTIRISIDCVALSIGWFMSGPIGVGTLILAFGVGPLIQFNLKLLENIISFNNIKDKSL